MLPLLAGPMIKAQVFVPGLSCTTLEVPSHQGAAAWNGFLEALRLADGIVALRFVARGDSGGKTGGCVANSEFLSQVYEIVDSRPLFIISVCRGVIDDSLLAFVGVANVVLSDQDTIFCMPRESNESAHPIVQVALKRRLSEGVLRRLMLVGDSIEATEAQRLGLADFVGDDATVEKELARLILRKCSPITKTG
mmetsp:Transcript_94965/g.207705  ORF Transcript_94965/g.207705 Transcript_94965/m.207705 type:complete len:194 (+) Transcript_94965:77-658(+)